MDARPPVTWALIKTYLIQRLWKIWSIFPRSWACIWRLAVGLAVALLLLDMIIPTIGNKYVPPRHLNQPKAPYGLSLVESQADRIFIPAVDIVFVHGLGAFPDTTWQKRPEQGAQDTVSEKPISWIRDLLARDLREARLMFFNYDSTTYNNAPQKDLQDIGMELLQAFAVSRLRQSPWERNRPIIFLCHSYGGLVLKEALLQATSISIEFQDILQNIRGIIFLGTPHRGTKYSDYARAIALRLNRINANPDIFLPLKVNSLALLDQHAKFMDRYDNLDLVNFYETRALPLFRYPIRKFWYKDIIVEKFSATFENATNAPIDSHHSGLNKFDSLKDPGYRRVRFALEHIINRIIKQRIETQDESSFRLHEANSSTSSRMPQSSQGARYVIPFSTVNTYTERPKIMNQVVNDLSVFQDFRDPPLSVALWGIGGSGKSQLALRFAEKHKDVYNTIIWIDAHSPVTATRSYAVAFERLKLDYPQHIFDDIRNNDNLYDRRGFSTDDDWVIRTVKEWLENASCKWLVVIDNADNLAWIQDIMPRGRTGSVVITSRDRMVYRFVNHAIQVDKMNTEEALALLFRSANIPSSSRQKHGADLDQQKGREQQALKIVDKLGYLALAIDLAGAYISQHDLVQEDLSLYLDFFNANSVALLGNEALQDEQNYHHTVATVWETSFAAINKTSPDSAQLLIFLAHLSETHIEDRLFHESSSWLYQETMAHAGWKPFAPPLEKGDRLPSLYVFVRALTIVVLLSPYLSGQTLNTAPILLRLVPLILGVIGAIVVLRSHDLSEGSGEMKDHEAIDPEEIVALLTSGAGYAATVPFRWLPAKRKGLPHLREVFLEQALVCTSALCMFWFCSKYLVKFGEKRVMDSMDLLDQLDIFRSSVLQLSAVKEQLRGVLEYSRSGRLDWVPSDTTLLACIPIVLIVAGRILVFFELLHWATALLDARIPNGRLIQFSKAKTSWSGFETFSCIFLTICLSVGSCFEDRIFVWGLRKLGVPPPLRIPPALIDNLLTTTSDGHWDPRTYSDAMAPLTRFSLMQREADYSYSLHVLVRWWACQRLPFTMQQAWAREAERFVSMSYSSNTCWSDPLCQQMLIPHLIVVANLGITTSAFSHVTSQNILKKLYRSLRLVGKSYGIASDV